MISVTLVGALNTSAQAGLALPIGTSNKIGNAVNDALNFKAAQRGFVGNDPRAAATSAAISTVLTVAATSAKSAGWIGIALTAIGLALPVIEAGWNWLFNSDGTVTVNRTGAPSTAGYNVAPFYQSSFGQHESWSASPYDAIANVAQQENKSIQSYRYAGTNNGYAAFEGVTAEGAVISAMPRTYGTPDGYNCTGNTAWNGTSCVATPASDRSTKTVPLSEALADITDADLDNNTVSDDLIAQLANAAWQNAAQQPGYAGLPVDYSNPITAADVAAARGASAAPTLRDLLASPSAEPISASNPVNISNTSAGTNTNAGTGTNSATNPVATGSGAAVNLGNDPQIQQPALESTENGASILAPLTGLFSGIKHYVVPEHNSECYKPTFSVFGKTFTISAHCDLAEQNRGVISVFMIAAYTITALLVVLAA